MTVQDPLLAWLFSLQGPSLKWDIETARRFSAELGHPARGFRSLHVAGTNGKGSVAAMVQAIAIASGLHAGLTTSPHLVHVEERIRLGARDIDPALLRRLITRLADVARAACDAGRLERHPSFFEMLTLAAFLAFREDHVQLAVVETGLGGRLDATNVLVPEAAVITTIGLDHVKTLGGSLESIATEKAGIIKPGIPVIAGFIAPRPLMVLEKIARAHGAPFHAAASELEVQPHADGTFDVVTPQRTYGHLRLALAGAHQRRNAALAIRATEILRSRGIPLLPDAVATGLATVRWPARLERFAGPPSVVVDGAHNDEGVRALAGYLAEQDRALRGARPRRILVFGLSEGRDARQLMEPLAPLVDGVVLTRAPISKALDTETIAAAVRDVVEICGSNSDVGAALRRAIALVGETGEVVVAGSLYLAGEARRVLIGDGRPAAHPVHESLPALDAAEAPAARPHTS